MNIEQEKKYREEFAHYLRTVELKDNFTVDEDFTLEYIERYTGWSEAMEWWVKARQFTVEVKNQKALEALERAWDRLGGYLEQDEYELIKKLLKGD